MFPKLAKSMYIDPFGANESAISKCKDATRQVLYENFICCIFLYCGLMMSAFAHFYLIDRSSGWKVSTFPGGDATQLCILPNRMWHHVVHLFAKYVICTCMNLYSFYW